MCPNLQGAREVVACNILAALPNLGQRHYDLNNTSMYAVSLLLLSLLILLVLSFLKRTL